MIWPAVQMLNFRVLPIQFQIVSYQELAGSRLPCTDTSSSLLSPLSVSLGPSTFLSPIPPKRRRHRGLRSLAAPGYMMQMVSDRSPWWVCVYCVRGETCGSKRGVSSSGRNGIRLCVRLLYFKHDVGLRGARSWYGLVFGVALERRSSHCIAIDDLNQILHFHPLQYKQFFTSHSAPRLCCYPRS